MNALSSLLTSVVGSTIGKKIIVALTGLALVGFLVGHMAGNLQMFLPAPWINAYAHHLEQLGPGLWIIRASLLVIFVTHIIATIALVRQNRAARPVAYGVNRTSRATLASRTMIWSGLTLLAFIVFHLLHFTVRATDPRFAALPPDPEGLRDVHTMVILGFQHPLVSAFYLLAMFLLCSHLSHGVSSIFQTLGLGGPALAPVILNGGRALALVVFLGFASIPVAVLAGLIPIQNPNFSQTATHTATVTVNSTH